VKAFLKFLGAQWGAVVPFTLPLAVVAVGRAARSPRPHDRFLFWCFAPMIGFFGALSWTMPTHVLWPLPSWLSVTVLMAGLAAEGGGKLADFYRRRASWVAGVTSALFLVGCAHLAFLLPGIPPPPWVHGWGAVAARTSELRAGLPAGSFVLGLGRKYFVASQLAFHLREPSAAYGWSPLGRPDLQFDYWTDVRALAGRDAVVVVEKGHAAEAAGLLTRAFRVVEPAGALPASSPKCKQPEFLFFLARGYVPQLLARSNRFAMGDGGAKVGTAEAAGR
jgi:hypothetical protein